MRSTLSRPLSGLALCWALALPAPAMGLQQGLAPDGQPGFGSELELNELLGLMRASREEQRAWIGGLEGLASEVRLLFAAATEEYRGRGYFELLDGSRSRSLEDLHTAWREAQAEPEAEPEAILARKGPRAQALAGMILDPRFRARAQLHEGLQRESAEVAAGLAVLRGAATSFVTLTPEEARSICRRVDFSASLLRAMRSDLLSLRTSASSARVALAQDPKVTALIAIARTPDAGDRRAALAEALAEAAKHAELMGSALFSARLQPRVADHLRWRERAQAEAARHLVEARTYLPGTPESENASAEIVALRKHERVAFAGYSARAGLAADPLQDELAFIAARAADFQWGSLESRALYDRFLFLRGIQHFDHRTLKGRHLDEWEQEALTAVQRLEPYERPEPPARD